MNMLDSNKVIIEGEIVTGFMFSHEVFGEGFYLFSVKTHRMSESVDVLPIMISDRMIDTKKDCVGKFVRILGQLRSYNQHNGDKNRLVLSVFAREVEFLETESAKINRISLDGYICKAPVYRRTPLGREIADVLVAINRPYGKSDYIPCICWGRNARYASALPVGTEIKIQGRIQSREYTKKVSETEAETRTAYEVSVSKMEVEKVD